MDAGHSSGVACCYSRLIGAEYMSDLASEWSPATSNDLAEVLPMMEAFYQEEHLPYDAEVVRGAVVELLSNSSLGHIRLLRVNGVAAGYLVAILGYGIEFGGRYVLLDELYLRPETRGAGRWRQGFRAVEEWARDNEIGALRLEVNHHNEKAKRLYLNDGFSDDERSILTKRLTVSPASGRSSS